MAEYTFYMPDLETSYKMTDNARKMGFFMGVNILSSVSYIKPYPDRGYEVGVSVCGGSDTPFIRCALKRMALLISSLTPKQ